MPPHLHPSIVRSARQYGEQYRPISSILLSRRTQTPKYPHLRHCRPFSNPPPRALVDAVRELAAVSRRKTNEDMDYVRFGSALGKLHGLIREDFDKKRMQDEISDVESLRRTLKELDSILKADEKRAKPNWSAFERKVLRMHMAAAMRSRGKATRYNARYFLYGIFALAGFGAWHLITGSALFSNHWT